MSRAVLSQFAALLILLGLWLVVVPALFGGPGR